ncbi:MAG: YkgJ family cysteine cluster protein [Deltaproteobacteria bacterium]
MSLSLRLNVLRPAACSDCGLCCEGIGSPVAVYATRPGLEARHPFRPEGLPPELIREIDEHFLGLFRGQEPQEQCLWFDPVARCCRHYEWRPQVCRDYELGGPACLSLRREHLASQD